jgi:hypothetical protein
MRAPHWATPHRGQTSPSWRSLRLGDVLISARFDDSLRSRIDAVTRPLMQIDQGMATKTSVSALVSPGTRLLAKEVNAIWPPLRLIDAWPLPEFAWVPTLARLTRLAAPVSDPL